MNVHQVYMWKQDPTVVDVGITKTYIRVKLNDGPNDDDIEIVGMPFIESDENEDYLENYEDNPKRFDAVHTYAVVRKVLNFYRRALNRNRFTQNIEWPWGASKLKIYPHAGEKRNAFYSREDKCLKFFYFLDEETLSVLFTCRSYDIVSHETGHAILDSLKPDWYGNHKPIQTRAFHESFADLTAIFSLLSQFDICDLLITISKGQLSDPNFISSIGEQYGISKKKVFGIRNAVCKVTFEEALATGNKYSLSTVFTSGIYSIIVGYFQEHVDPERYNLVESLFRVSQDVLDLLLTSLLSEDLCENELFKNMAAKMYRNEKDNARKNIIVESFNRVGILF